MDNSFVGKSAEKIYHRHRNMKTIDQKGWKFFFFLQNHKSKTNWFSKYNRTINWSFNLENGQGLNTGDLIKLCLYRLW